LPICPPFKVTFTTFATSLLCNSKAFLQFENVYPVFFLRAARADFSTAKMREDVWKNLAKGFRAN